MAGFILSRSLVPLIRVRSILSPHVVKRWWQQRYLHLLAISSSGIDGEAVPATAAEGRGFTLIGLALVVASPEPIAWPGVDLVLIGLDIGLCSAQGGTECRGMDPSRKLRL